MKRAADETFGVTLGETLKHVNPFSLSDVLPPPAQETDLA